MKSFFAALLVVALTATAAATAPFSPLVGATNIAPVVQVQGKKDGGKPAWYSLKPNAPKCR